MSERPLILLSNDDGLGTHGLCAMEQAVADLGELLVVAPDRDRSGSSHSITLDRPLRVQEVGAASHGLVQHAVSGTPVDCVYLALHHLAPRRPALCISGINHGYNLGADVFYSGTVAAAIEATLRGIPSIALSMQRHLPFDPARAAALGRTLAQHVLARGLPPRLLLNVNLPAVSAGEAHWTRLGARRYHDVVDARQDLRGRSYYWIGGPEATVDELPGTDGHAVSTGRGSITPLGLDLTDTDALRRLSQVPLPGVAPLEQG